MHIQTNYASIAVYIITRLTMKQLLSILILSLFISINGATQDIHFSNYEYSPLYLTPAKTGAFAGTYRVGGQVREQFNSFIEEPYQTVMLFLDSPGFFVLKDKHWLGFGLNMFSDKAGDLALQNSGVLASAAYHMSLGEDFRTVLTFGIQYGATQRKINKDNYRSYETLSGNLNDSDLDLLENFNPSTNDLNLGISLKKYTSDFSYFETGIALYHATQPEYLFTNSNIRNPIGRRINAYGEYHLQASNQLKIKPVIVLSRMYNFQNLFGQFNMEYRLTEKSTTVLKGGIGYRSGDAVQLMAGMIFKGWNVGLSYDLTVSSAADFTNRTGAIELGVYRIFTVNKQPKIDPKALCPRL